MTEAVKQICKYTFDKSDIIRIYAEPFAYNIASCRVPHFLEWLKNKLYLNTIVHYHHCATKIELYFCFQQRVHLHVNIFTIFNSISSQCPKQYLCFRNRACTYARTKFWKVGCKICSKLQVPDMVPHHPLHISDTPSLPLDILQSQSSEYNVAQFCCSRNRACTYARTKFWKVGCKICSKKRKMLEMII